MSHTVTCHFCGTTNSLDQAVEDGWVPYFYSTDGNSIEEPACPPCADRHLKLGPDGEWEQTPQTK